MSQNVPQGMERALTDNINFQLCAQLNLYSKNEMKVFNPLTVFRTIYPAKAVF